MRGARVDVWVAGEDAPRRFEQADAVVRLGRGYRTLSVDLTSAVHERDPATYKCVLFLPLSVLPLLWLVFAAAARKWMCVGHQDENHE